MIKMGTVIGDRYEVLEKIGTGGMSDVYRAKDEKLSRMVAIKILKQEFSENDNFVQKFRTEAQAAAGLMHPNIVNVYDVGDEKGIYYIVMELVDGITLKKYIEEKNRLTVKEAVSISIQVAMGLEAAHNHNIIHRDIKPQNIIISKEGKVKVTDFGIAKAATSNTITSNVMGSVHYTSPEQARGGYSDAKSDIYSLGVTMFEMLTGRVPFNGDTTVAIAIKHIQEPIQSPSEFVPDVPISVENIVLKCCQKSPDRRYQTVGELIADLKQALITPDADFVRLDDPDQASVTRVATQEEVSAIQNGTEDPYARGRSQQAAEIGVSQVGYAQSGTRDTEYDYNRTRSASSSGGGSRTRESEPARSSSARRSQSTAAGRRSSSTMQRRTRREEELRADVRSGKKMESMTLITAIVIAILVIVILAIAIGSALGWFDGSDEPGNASSAITMSSDALTTEGAQQTGEGIEVLTVTGLSFAEAKSQLEAKGFAVVKTDNTEADAPRNTVIYQSPEGGTRAAVGSQITLSVSTGEGYTGAGDAASTASTSEAASEASTQALITVPKVTGGDLNAAQTALIGAGLRVATKIDDFYDDSEAGTIIGQNPEAGDQVEPGTEVLLARSKGPEPPKTYSYSGRLEDLDDNEKAALEAAGIAYIPGGVGLKIEVVFNTTDAGEILRLNVDKLPCDLPEQHGLNSSSGHVNLIFSDDAGHTATIQRGLNFTEE